MSRAGSEKVYVCCVLDGAGTGGSMMSPSHLELASQRDRRDSSWMALRVQHSDSGECFLEPSLRCTYLLQGLSMGILVSWSLPEAQLSLWAHFEAATESGYQADSWIT